MAPIVTWIDLEMFAFFFCPIFFGCLKFGYRVLTIGYLITTAGMSLYAAFPGIFRKLGGGGEI